MITQICRPVPHPQCLCLCECLLYLGLRGDYKINYYTPRLSEKFTSSPPTQSVILAAANLSWYFSHTGDNDSEQCTCLKIIMSREEGRKILSGCHYLDCGVSR